MTDTTIVTIAVAALAALPPTIAALAALRQSKAAKKETEENTKVTIATDQKADALIAQVTEVHAATNGHLSIMTANAEKLEAKLEMALQQNADLQGTNATIVEMMKSLLAAEAADKKEIVRAIEINGSGGSERR